MTSWRQYSDRFNRHSLRERGLIGLTLLVAVVFLWWNYHAAPTTADIERQQTENKRIAREVNSTRAVVADIRRRIAAGVHQEKQAQLVKLGEELDAVEERLRVETIELIDPEKMFRLMNQLVYPESRLSLLSLKRREVRPAFEIDEDEAQEPGIYRHVLEIALSGKYLDILQYMRSLEALDWKLLWDEIELESEEYPAVTVKVVISTLSTRKEWVGI